MNLHRYRSTAPKHGVQARNSGATQTSGLVPALCNPCLPALEWHMVGFQEPPSGAIPPQKSDYDKPEQSRKDRRGAGAPRQQINPLRENTTPAEAAMTLPTTRRALLAWRHDAARRPRGGPAGRTNLAEPLHVRDIRRLTPAMIASEAAAARHRGSLPDRADLRPRRDRGRARQGARAGGDRALLEGVRNGDLDLVVCSTVLLGDYIPQARVFSVPFLFRDYAHARAVLDAPIGQDVLAELAVARAGRPRLVPRTASAT